MARCLRTFPPGRQILVVLLLINALRITKCDVKQDLPDINPNGPCKAEIALHCNTRQKAAASKQSPAGVSPRHDVQPAGNNSQQGTAETTAAAGTLGRRRTLLSSEAMAAALQQLKTKLNLRYSVTDPEKLLAGPTYARCLKNIMLNQMPTAIFTGESLSTHCRVDVMDYYRQLAQDTGKDYQLVAACAEGIISYCPDTASTSLFKCLLSNKHKATRTCAAALSTRTASSAGWIDWNQDMLNNCASDGSRYCAEDWELEMESQTTGGFTTGCLKDMMQAAIELNMTGQSWLTEGPLYDQLSDQCAAAIFRREMADAEDIRFSFDLSRACSQELSMHCPGVNPGKGEALMCLERQTDNWSLGEDCRQAVRANQLLRAADSRLDWRLRELCRSDVLALCSSDKEYVGGLNPALMLDDWNAPPMAGVNVTLCLRRKWGAITSSSCKSHVRHITARAFANTLLDGPLLRACTANISKHCMDQNNALVCLKGLVVSGLSLAPTCAKVLQERLLEAADNYDLLPDVVAACKTERKFYCEGVPPDHGAVLDCLADFQSDERFGEPCREALTGQFMLAVSDIRLLSSLHQGCKSDILRLCPGVEPGSGRVIKCLQQNGGNITSSSCRRQLLRLQGFAAHDYRLDYHLREACSADVAKYCIHIVPGNGRMHACLRENQANLSANCRTHVETAEAREFQDVSINPSIASACKSSITSFCGKLKGSFTELMPCLKQHMADPTFAQSCKEVLTAALARKSTNYNLQPALQKACDADVSKLCPEVAKAKAARHAIAVTMTTPTAKKVLMAAAAPDATNPLGVEATLSWAPASASSPTDVQYQTRDAVAHVSRRSFLQATTAVATGAASTAAANSTPAAVSVNHDPELVCLAKHLTGLSPECRQEVAAEVHRELLLYMPGMPLTAACDTDAQTLCDAGSAQVTAILQTGSILGCLVTRPEKLSSDCWAVISLFDKEQLAYAKSLEAGTGDAGAAQWPHTEQPQTAVQDAVLEKVSEQLQEQVASQIKAHFMTQWRSQPNGSLSLEVEQYIASVAKGAQSSGFLFGVLASVLLLSVAAGVLVVVRRGKRVSSRITRAPDGTLVVKDGNV